MGIEINNKVIDGLTDLRKELDMSLGLSPQDSVTNFIGDFQPGKSSQIQRYEETIPILISLLRLKFQIHEKIFHLTNLENTEEALQQTRSDIKKLIDCTTSYIDRA